jgi:hypothetical protein
MTLLRLLSAGGIDAASDVSLVSCIGPTRCIGIVPISAGRPSGPFRHLV